MGLYFFICINFIFDTMAASFFQKTKTNLGKLVILLTFGIFTLLEKKLFQWLTLQILYNNFFPYWPPHGSMHK